MRSLQKVITRISHYPMGFKPSTICGCRGISNRSLSFKLCLISSILLALCYCLEYQFCHMDYFFNHYLIALNDIMKSHDIRAFLFYGPLLGLIRDQKLMPWDYDIDFAVHFEDSSKLLSLRHQFELLGFDVYGRGEFIWHKLNGDTFQITTPILRLYTTNKYHIEFFEMNDETSSSAKQKGYVIQGPLKLPKDETWSCLSIEDPCFEKSKIFPLQTWNENVFGVDFLIPNDAEYCLTQLYGKHWKTPMIKGWKMVTCYNQWNSSTLRRFKWLVMCWYTVLFMLYLYQRYTQRTIKQPPLVNESEKEHLICTENDSEKEH